MRPKLSQRHALFYRDAVIEHMQVRTVKVDHALPARVFDICIVDIPFLRHSPVEHLRAARHVVNLEWNALSEDAQCFANAMTSNASANRKEFGYQSKHIPADRLNV